MPTGSFTLLGCPVGHKLNNGTGQDLQACNQCSEGQYIADSNDNSISCLLCPKSALCPNRGPPIFDTSSLSGKLVIDGDRKDIDAIVASFAVALGLDPSLLVVRPDTAVQSKRRENLEIQFDIYADEKQLQALSQKMLDPNVASAMATSLAAQNIVARVTPVPSAVTIADKREGEVWELKGGVYILRSCPRGFLLINTTLETQECKECEAGTFSVASENGCRVADASGSGWIGGCDNRACITCADGATCSRGRTSSWKHFVPKALQLGGTVLQWINIILSTETITLSCDQSMNCTPSTNQNEDLQNQADHVWEYQLEKQNFILRHCPPGHQLVNSSGEGVFNPTLQLCRACGPSKYIIDPYGPCQECPKGAECPDGALFLSKAQGSVWENVFASAGGIQNRIIECPAGHALERADAYPNADLCNPCPPNQYRLEPSFLNTSKPHCIPCDTKATCRGTDVVEAIEGYWRFSPTKWDEAFEYLHGTECNFPGKVYQRQTTE